MKTQDVKLYAAQQLHRLQALPDNQRRAELAKLRRGIGHVPESCRNCGEAFCWKCRKAFRAAVLPRRQSGRSTSP